MSELTEMLIRHEGLRLKPYKDSVGKLTIGVGHNLEDNGITKDIAMLILKHDIADIIAELYAAYPWMQDLNVPRQDALINMAFNLGLPRFSEFHHMITALGGNNWAQAHDEMLNSKWADQVGDRAKELAQIVLTGEYHNG